MKYIIDNYFASIDSNDSILSEVINGFGVVESEEIIHTRDFLVYDINDKKVKVVNFDPTNFEIWNGSEIVIDLAKKEEYEYYEKSRSKLR